MEYFIPVDEDVTKSVLKELKCDNKERFDNNLRLLEEWIAYQTYLPQDYDRVLLTTFLRQCKNDIEKAKKKFKSYLIGVYKMHDLFIDRMSCLDDAENVFNYMYFYPLPKPSSDGYRIIFTKIHSTNPETMDLRRLFQYTSMMADYMLHSKEEIAGEIYITDHRNTHVGFLPKLINSTIKMMVEVALKCYPNRIKVVHVISESPLIHRGVNLFKTFLTEKLRNKFFIHKNVESLLEHVPLEYLPADLGGCQKSLAELSKEFTKLLKKNHEIFEKIAALKVEVPIPEEEEDAITSIEFGVEGAFRKLEID